MSLVDVKKAVVNGKLSISSEVNGMYIVHSLSNFGRLVCFIKIRDGVIGNLSKPSGSTHSPSIASELT